MRRFAFVVLVLLLFSSVLFAQKVGIYAGYSYVRMDTTPALNSNGFEIQPMFKLSKHFAVMGDFTGTYASAMGVTFHQYTYMGGPAYVAKVGKSAQFNFHYLVGGANFGCCGDTLNSFAMAPGIGLDFKVANKVWIRPVEFDYVYARYIGRTNNDFRYGAGVLFMF